MANELELREIQAALAAAGLDGWLFYDHHFRDPIAYRVLKIKPAMCTRRWYYLIPKTGEPSKLVHRIESGSLDGLPGAVSLYSRWSEQRAHLQKMLEGKKRLAMQYSPLNAIPYVGLVDAGTIELVKSLGVEVVTSADLVQLFEARWSPGALASHLEAGKAVHSAVRAGFDFIRLALAKGGKTSELEVQQEILRVFAAQGIVSDEPPIVAVNANSANPHYAPTPATSRTIGAGDFVLLDVWGKLPDPGSVYFDITWTGYVGREIPNRHAEIFAIVSEARDAAVRLVQAAVLAGREIHGFEVDDAARDVIRRGGYEQYFVHRTGHSIGEDVHGNGANMDNLETHDTRRIIPGTCFSVEPGIYLEDFGVRSEVNVYVDEHEARVTGEVQHKVVPIVVAGS
jgi:Xaa-Pro aminopeptidase